MASRARNAFSYYSGGKLVRIPLVRSAHLLPAAPKARPRGERGKEAVARPAVRARGVDALRLGLGKSVARAALFPAPEPPAAAPALVHVRRKTVTVIPTSTFVVEGAKRAEIRRLRVDFGTEVVAEGSHGKVLLRVPTDAADPVALAFDLARRTYRRGVADAAHPNFIRAYSKLRRSTASAALPWNLDNPGEPGLVGADVHARAAWTITRGSADIKVAVLDEGVDTLHPDLREAVAAERDFVDGKAHARPDGDDAHGTACAGIIASRSRRWPGLGPQLSLIAARIAKDDGLGNWIFDDFDTADAIDWAWTTGADVLSNSWGGGPPVDVITNAFQRARTKGRRGKGAVVVVAAGNDQAPVDYPGTLPWVLTVGASNQWDQRKTRASRDGEDWWGSNYGPSLALLAPGVRIATTDIRGGRGYEAGRYTLTFNGTSAATPHVAAAAALILSVAPALSEARVREIIAATAELLPGQRGWSPQNGSGRLNVYAALRAARRG